MKRVFSRITATILSLGFLSACAPDPHSSSEPGSVRVLMPAVDEGGAYSLKVEALHGIEDIDTVSGKFARFYMSPRIIDNRLDGVSPKGRFIRNDDGTYVPTDQLTQQLVSIYSHLEKLAQLDKELGAGEVNQWPRQVGVAVRIKGQITNNAFYDGKSDSLLFVPYNKSGLPIAVNGGILAHEHFHSLFYKLALRTPEAQPHSLSPRGSTPRRESKMNDESLVGIANSVMSRGLNEGLADFWGWVYTGDPDFIAVSLPGERTDRSLRANELALGEVLPSANTMKMDILTRFVDLQPQDFDEYLTGYSYLVGTKFSRSLKAFTKIYSEARQLDDKVARKEIAKAIIRLLPKIGEDFEVKKELYTSDRFVDSLVTTLGDLKQKECDYMVMVKNSLRKSDADYEFTCAESGENFKITLSAAGSTPVKNESLEPQ